MCLFNFKNLISHIVFLSCIFTHFSQAQDTDNKETNKAYDALVHLDNTNFYNGPEFQDVYLSNSNSNRYFNTFDFSTGSITYKNQVYFDVLLKYDIYEGQIITRSDDDLNLFKVALISDYVSDFNIYNRKFIRIPDFIDDDSNKFFEIGHEGETFSLFIKHQKKKKEVNVNFTLRYSFFNENYYLIHTNGSYEKFESIKELKKILPELGKQIQSYYKKNKAVYKSNNDRFMIDLIKNLNL